MTATLLLSPLLLLVQSDTPTPPPGMVFVEGGRTKIGLDEDAAKELILETGTRAIWNETPEHEVRVDDFFLMLTEVTNEQFAEFVTAANAKPPELWGKKAIDAASMEYLEKQGLERQKAREAGETPPDRVPFVRDVWWNRNWEDSEWEVPEGSEALPVVSVNHDQARAYARWAGMRLPTEEEYQCAVRGRDGHLYPWGEAWEEKHAVTLEAGLRRLQPVGTFPTGASRDGILDLVGNVWEWTASPWLAYPRYESDRIKVKERGKTRTIELMASPPWNSNLAITVGGSFSADRLAARITTRRPTERFQTTDAVGFRCAASQVIGRDMATIVLKDDISRAVRGDLDFDFALTVATDRWKSRRGKAADRYAEKDSNPLDRYAVITDYDFFLFTPVADAGAASVTSLTRDSIGEEGPVVLGFFSTTLALKKPELEPGTYVLAWRGAGRIQRPEKKENESGEEVEAPPTMEEELGLDPKTENFIFLSASGKPLAFAEAKGLNEDRLRAGKITTRSVEADERRKITAHDLIELSAAVPAGRRGFLFDITFEVEKDATSGDWRQ